jgi:predicted DNA-binding transcriptional regulator AlpA
MQKFLTTDQVLEILGIHHQTLANWVKGGKLPKPYKILGRNLFAESAVLEWIKGERDTIAGIYARFMRLKEEEATLSKVDFGFLEEGKPPVLAEIQPPVVDNTQYYGDEEEVE